MLDYPPGLGVLGGRGVPNPAGNSAVVSGGECGLIRAEHTRPTVGYGLSGWGIFMRKSCAGCAIGKSGLYASRELNEGLMPMLTPDSPAPLPRTLIVMGVSGCGKTLIANLLAERLGGVCEDADDFHSAANKQKMGAGIPLTDEDRWPWYAALRARIEEMRAETPLYILACSALKEIYREKLRANDEESEMVFIHLKGPKEVIFSRMAKREGHYMPVTLLDSQFAILEESADLWNVSLEQTPEEMVEEVARRLGRAF
jgi:gluconokinase